MAAGDTISGQLRVIKEMASGSRPLVAGPFSSFEADQKASFKDAIYLNVAKARGLVSVPFGAGNLRNAHDAVFRSGEKLQVQHLSASLQEAALFTADEVFLGIVELDHNLPAKHPDRLVARTLTAANQELVANFTTSTSTWVTAFQDTVPDRKTWFLAGMFCFAAVEVA